MGSAEELGGLLRESEIASRTASQLARYLALLEKWNARINLVSTTDWRVIGPMFREAIWASRLYPAEAVYHLDVGSGAGFPALLLKILVPRINLDLVESRERKSQFLEAAAHTLELDGIRVHPMRLTDFLLSADRQKTWDCISWKAMKFSTEDLLALRRRTRQDTRLWMFHGREPAVKDPGLLDREFQMLQKQKIPGTRDSFLSIYRLQ